jgi:TRAP-type C4-dicarboxylate transport system permease small subunit
MAPLRATFLPLTIAGLLAGLVAWQGWQLWETTLGHETLALKIGAVFVPAATAGLVYGVLALTFKVPAAKELLEFAFVKFKR